jgi:NAD(P)-dependent dehydrogenase (short-subunit alcohol dehydrogenase family)
MNDFKQSVVVFGASGGIGSSLCRRLADHGNRVLAVSRSIDRLAELQGLDGVQTAEADASDLESVKQLLLQLKKSWGELDSVVNCAGSLLLKAAHQTSFKEWREVLSANLDSAFNVVHASVRQLASPGGSIVLISSAAARTGFANHEAIGAAKAGVVGLTLSAAATYAPRGIRVNCIAPGLVETPLTRKLTENAFSLKVSQEMHPLGRIGKASDVVSGIQWLLDPEQSWMTGQVLGIDGGLSSVRPRQRA